MPTHLALTIAAALFAQPAPAPTPAAAPPPPARFTETTRQRNLRMRWWREARFGMFIHWGLYSIPAGEWNGKPQSGTGEWILRNSKAPLDDYKPLINKFNPVKFSAAEWAEIAADAGMKYVVITTKHHDGFALWDSKVSDFDLGGSPYKGDILRSLSQAVQSRGMNIGWYYSILDWQHPDYLPRLPWDKRPTDTANFDRYVTYMKSHLQELLTGPVGGASVLWFDGEWEQTWTHERGIDLDAFVRSLNPAIIINNRVDKGRNDMAGLDKPYIHADDQDPDASVGWAGDFGTPEQEVPATGLPGVDWESCMTMNDTWGFRRDDANWKSSQTLIRTLIDVASKGGNFLLNVGPTAEGEIPKESVDRLRDIGRWMRINGEAIHATSAGPLGPLPFGRSTQKRISPQETKLFLHVFDWPADNRFTLPGFANNAQSVRVLGDDTRPEPRPAIQSLREDDALVITVPGGPLAGETGAAATVIELTLAGDPVVFSAPRIEADSDIFTDRLPIRVLAGGGLKGPEAEQHTTVRFTTDGSEPTAASPLADESPITIDATTTLLAREFIGRTPVSPIARRVFTRVEPRLGMIVELVSFGLNTASMKADLDALPARDDPRFAPAQPADDISPDAGLAPPADANKPRERYALKFTGYINIEKPGLYTFSLNSDDGSALYIADEKLIDNDGTHTARERTATIALGQGHHPITILYFNKTGGRTLELSWQHPGQPKQRVPASAWRR
jgi:alpha-L-fucosidase